MEQLQAPPGSHLGQEPASGGFAAGAGPAPTTAEPEPVPGASPRPAGGSGTEAGAEGRTVSKSREPRAESREPRAESREPRAESREPRAESREPRAESREPRAESREPRAESREPRAESREPRAESREPRAESREPRAESREPSSCPSPGRAVPRLNSGSRRRPPESSPAAPSRRGFPRHRFPFRRLAALAGRFCRSLPAAVLLALAALGMLAGTSSPSMAQSGFTVARDWELAPSTIPRGGSFRLLYVTSNARNAESSDGSDYNAFVWALAGIMGTNRHSAMTTDQARRSYGVWCTSTFDSNGITDTTGTGVPIYWLNGNKVADNYADFYDGGWDDEANPRDESGNLVTTFVDRIWTGCNHDGTGKSGATLGHSGGRAAFGGLNHGSHGPLSNSGTAADTALQGRLYGITRIYTVEQARIASAAITSTPRNTTRGYFVGEEIRVRIRYNEPVAVTRANDPPSVWLKVGNEVRPARYASGSGTADLVFAYTVQSGDVDSDGVSLCSDTSLHGLCGRISLNGGTIKATADDTRVPVNYPELGNQAAHGIGGPQVIGVAMQSAPASGDTYAAAETVTVRLTFAEAVDVTGRPFVYLNVGGEIRKAVFTSGSGSANLDFAFTVAAADFDANGVSVCSNRLLDPGCGRVQLDGGAIVASADALVADLVLPAQDDQSGHKVEGTPVTVDPGGRTMGDPAMGTVSSGWSLHPEGVAPGDPFRLIFVTSTNRTASSSDIDDYNRFVIGAAGSGHADIVAYKDGFRALGSTGSVDARDNTATTGTGVPIYWLNGNKVADDYADFYDNSWDDESGVRNEHGSAEADRDVWTGSDQSGAARTANHLGM